MARLLAAFVAVWLGALSLSAATVGVRLQPMDGAPCSGSIHATGAGTAVQRLLGESEASVALPHGTAWRITLASEDCWAPPVELPAGPAEVTMPAWRKRLLRGELRTRPGIAAPETLRAVVQAPPGGAAIAATETACRVRERRWVCELPSTTVDVRLLADGFAPVYLWDVAPATASAGTVQLERGGSVAGWVARNDRSAEEVTVELTPAVYGDDAFTHARLGARRLSAKANARGFFQLTGVTPGVFTLAARASDASPALLEELRVDDVEVVVAEPLLLTPLALLDVHVTPPSPKPELPWRVELDRVTLRGTGRERVTAGSTTHSGHWSAGKLPRGRYHLAILDPAGSTVATRELQVENDRERVAIAIGEIPIRGTVFIGEQPVEGTIAFDAGGRTLTFSTGADGAFDGAVPDEGRWRVRITPRERTQQVRSAADVRRREGEEVATVDVHLPAGSVAGKVVDEMGNPVRGADILVLRGAAFDANAASGDDGTFMVTGLACGEVTVRARSGSVESDRVAATVASGEPAPLTLVMREPATVRIAIRQLNGAPVVGAMIHAVVQGRPREYVTGPTGTFTADVPSGTPFLDVAIIAPGLPVKLDRVPLHGDAPPVVQMSAAAGRLAIALDGAPPWPIVRRGAAALALPFLLAPRHPGGAARELVDGEFLLTVEPGEYQLCSGPRPGDTCLGAVVTAGGVTRLDAGTLWPQRERER
ncbi:MAG TPA: carboxypeptidase-like regulatory domain-containing protein [Thermoanaerobaculia bacterium]